jgi:hypothetical protein
MAPWAQFPGVPVTETLFLEAFGRLLRDPKLPGIVSDDEDLYSVFKSRAQLMSWSDKPDRRLLWGMNEAELTGEIDESRIGFVQVGLEKGVDPSLVLPAFAQCFDDALRRFGALELSGLQLTCSQLQPRMGSFAWNLVSGLNWFNAASTTRANALIVWENNLLGALTGSDLLSTLYGLNTGTFRFGPLTPVPEEHTINVPTETPNARIPHVGSDVGMTVILPEWSASAAALVLAMVIGAACANRQDVGNFTVRISRTG